VNAVPVENAEDESVLLGRGRERKGREEKRDLEEEEEVCYRGFLKCR
jgi:hypothetical protein